jgi:hypothetical protein
MLDSPEDFPEGKQVGCYHNKSVLNSLGDSPA